MPPPHRGEARRYRGMDMVQGLVMGEGHRYTLDGKPVPSVTKIVGSAYYQEVRELAGLPMELCSPFDPGQPVGSAAHHGTAVHNWIDKYLRHSIGKGKPEYNIPAEAVAFMHWLHEKNPTITRMEEPVMSTKLWYCGRVDQVTDEPVGYVLRDYKTGKYRRYNELQLAGYSIAMKEMGIAIQEAELLFLGADGKYICHRLDKRTLIRREMQFIQLRSAVLQLGILEEDKAI